MNSLDNHVVNDVRLAPDKGGEFGSSPGSEPLPTQQERRVQYLRSIEGNLDTAELLFDSNGVPSEALTELLLTLPLKQAGEGQSFRDLLTVSKTLTHREIEEILQKAFFRPTEAQFSFETAEQGSPPTKEQMALFRALGMVNPLTVPEGKAFDVGVVFGGLLGAIESRTKFMLGQRANLSSIALLGGQRAIVKEKEGGEKLEAALGKDYYKQLENAGSLPKTEFEIMQCVWESFCRQDESLRKLPVIEVNSELRLGNVKEAPGTPNTVVDLANTLTSGYKVPGLDSLPSTFLLASSQPYAARQREDFLSSMAVLSYPGLSEVSVVGYPTETTPSLKLYATEIAKWVHAQYLARNT